MKVNIEFDTEKPFTEQLNELKNFFQNKSNPNQPKLEDNNTPSNNEDISVVIRDGENKTTTSVKTDLSRMGFTYYKFKKDSKKEDPRWTQTCTQEYWNSIKDHSILQDLNIWNSGGDA